MMRGPKLSLPGNLHPATRALFEQASRLEIPRREIARRSGVGLTTLNQWATGNYSPSVFLLGSALETVGLTLNVAPAASE